MPAKFRRLPALHFPIAGRGDGILHSVHLVLHAHSAGELMAAAIDSEIDAGDVGACTVRRPEIEELGKQIMAQKAGHAAQDDVSLGREPLPLQFSAELARKLMMTTNW
jgi:hypothetical protein